MFVTDKVQVCKSPVRPWSEIDRGRILDIDLTHRTLPLLVDVMENEPFALEKSQAR